jgi:hypothetical protein
MSELGDALNDHPEVGFGSPEADIEASQQSFDLIVGLLTRALMLNDTLRSMSDLLAESLLTIGSVDVGTRVVFEAAHAMQAQLDMARAA